MAATAPMQKVERAELAVGSVARPSRWRAFVFNWSINILLLIGGVLMLVPFVWAFSTSFRLGRESFTLPPQWFPTDWRISNYQEVLDSLPFFRFVFNSFKIAGLITVIQIVTCSMAAFAFARLRFRGRDVALLPLPLLPDGAPVRDDHPDLRYHPPAGPAQQPLGADFAVGLQRLRHLPVAPVLHDDATRPGGRGPDRRRRLLRDLLADHDAPRRPGACDVDDLLVQLPLERVLPAADLPHRPGSR